MGVQTGQLLWTEILAGTHGHQAHHTKMQLEMTKDLIRQYEGPGKVVIVDYTSVRPQFVSRSEQIDDLPPLWQEFANAASLKLQAVCLCTWGIRHPQNHRPPLGTRFLLTNLTLPDDSGKCRCGCHKEDHIRLGSIKDPERRNMMTHFNVMLLLAAMNRLPRLSMHIRETKEVLDDVTGHMPEDVKDFFLQAFGDKIRSMGKGPASAIQSPKPRKSVLFQDQQEEAYPTESRMKQKAKHAAEKKHKPKQKLVHIEPGYDDCGEDDSFDQRRHR